MLRRFFCCVMVLVTILSCSSVAGLADSADKGYIIVTDTLQANSGTDVSDEIQSIIDRNPNRTIYFPDGEYLVSKPILTPAEPTKSVSLELSNYAVIKAVGNWQGSEAIIQLGGKSPANNTHTNGSNYYLDGGIIDGSGVANGISINSGRETAVRNVSIKNTVIGIHIMYGANSGSSDSDITGINIIGTGKTDSKGILIEGFDNTLTNIRIGNVFIGVHVKSSGNILRNIHPLYYSDYTDFKNSCGFLEDSSNNWYDYCYSDQFGNGFRTTGNGESIFHNCFCYWYSSSGEVHTAFRADKEFNSIITNFKIGFREDTKKNNVLVVGSPFGEGTIDNLSVSSKSASNRMYKAFMEDVTIFERIFGFFSILFDLMFNFSA